MANDCTTKSPPPCKVKKSAAIKNSNIDKHATRANGFIHMDVFKQNATVQRLYFKYPTRVSDVHGTRTYLVQCNGADCSNML